MVCIDCLIQIGILKEIIFNINLLHDNNKKNLNIINDFYELNKLGIEFNTTFNVKDKFLSIIINSSTESQSFYNLINFVKLIFEKNKINKNDIIILEINDPTFFENDYNISLFPFVKEIIIGYKLKYNKINFNLFEGVKKIKLNTNFNSILSSLPNNLEKLEFNYRYNQIIDILPNNIDTLKLGSNFNKLINISEYNVKKIYFGCEFNQNVNCLSPNLEILKFGYKFNQPVDNLPNSLKEIYFGIKFNQSVDNLPSSLVYLEFSNDFNHSVDNLPNSIEVIKFKSLNSFGKFSKPIDNLPNSIKHIELTIQNYSIPIKKLPKCLKKIVIHNKYAYSICKKINTENRLNIKNIIYNEKMYCDIIIENK